MERVEDVMNYPEDVIWGKADGKEPEACLKNHSESLLQTESSPEEEYRKLSGHIELKNVTFGYSRLAADKGFQFVPEAGQQSRFCWTFRLRQIHFIQTDIRSVCPMERRNPF